MMPAHMDGAVAPAVPWATKVSQRKAPGAMSAMAFIVNPVRPRVGFIVTSELSAIGYLLNRFSASGGPGKSGAIDFEAPPPGSGLIFSVQSKQSFPAGP